MMIISQKTLINKHDIAANKCKRRSTSIRSHFMILYSKRINVKKGQLASDHIFGFCKKNHKKLGFYKSSELADLPDIIYSTLANDINVTFNDLYQFVAFFIPTAQTQAMFNESIKSILTPRFDP